MAMQEVRDYECSLERSRQALTNQNRPSTFSMYGRDWALLPNVFAPIYSPSTDTAMSLLGLTDSVVVPRTGSMLEIGCGTGIIAVSSALAGCDRVVASDINPEAVRNAELNAARHGVDRVVRTVHSDLFDGLDQGERFDTIFWSSNYVLAPHAYEYGSVHERAYVDPGYAAHRRFLAEAPNWLAPNGSVLLHFSTRGDLVSLLRIAGECGRGLRMLHSVPVQEGEHEVEHMLIEVTVTPQRSASRPICERENHESARHRS
ncbi:class I SAM-dependent methyltransferase [Streptomyces sp. RPT161]|uniref:class I SAM-dependent methyltransferase n=1 Tax=Streptomyces sp. RPT161 TaxID=3015993 RepID=UPI0022B8A19C|nr:class I SAM-dependent methyltransferase [Streptomyces sp. RPT161]